MMVVIFILLIGLSGLFSRAETAFMSVSKIRVKTVSEDEEDPHQALVRELKEETGLNIEIIKPVYTFTAIRPHYQTVGIGFLCIPTNDQVKISFEHTDYKFVDEDELEKTLDPHIFNDIKKTIEEYNQIREYNELKREAN